MQSTKDTAKAIYITYKNNLSCTSIYPVTLYLALLIIPKYKLVVDNERQITIPKFIANEFILPLIPIYIG